MKTIISRERRPRRSAKRIMSIILSLVMLFSVTTGMTMTAMATPLTQSQAVSWANSRIGVKTGDGQCVALIKSYYNYLGISSVSGNGCDYATNSLPTGWQRIPYSSGFVAQPGDIAVWTWNKWAGNYGHVAIVTSANSTSMNYVDQGKTYDYVGHSGNNSYNNADWKFYGVIRPNFSSQYTNQPAPTYAYLSTNKSEYEGGEIITFNFDSNSVCKYYISVYYSKSGELVDSGTETNNYHLSSFLLAGKYSAHMSAFNDNGSLDSNWVDFYVYSGGVSTATISTDDSEYSLGDTVNFTNSSNANYARYYVSLYYSGETETSFEGWQEENFSFKPTRVGRYELYMSAYTLTNTVDSKWISFYVYSSGVSKATVATDKNKYTLGETVNLTNNCDASFARYYVSLYYSGDTEPTLSGWKDKKFTFNPTKAGKYEVYISAHTNTNTVDSKWISFYVYNPVSSCSHNYQESIIKAATCTQMGKKTFTCPLCNDSYTETVPKLPHKTVVDKAVAPTCTVDGKTEGSHCSVCGEILVTQETVKAIGHKEKIDAAVPATFTSEGKTEGKHCSICGTVLVAQKKVAMLSKKANTLSVKAKKPTVKYKKLKKKKQSISLKKAMTISKSQGAVSFKKSKGNKKISVSKSGKITLEKGLKKGTYKVKIKVTAAGNSTYKAATKTVTVTIKIK